MMMLGCFRAAYAYHTRGARSPYVCVITDFTRHSVEEIPPLFCPGVLLDMAAWAGVDYLPPRHILGAADLHGCVEQQGTPVPRGGVALVRTGYGRFWRG